MLEQPRLRCRGVRRRVRGSANIRLPSLRSCLVLGLAVIGGLWAWNYYSARESTDDARIDGHIAPVSARVGGTVIEILVDENDTVNAQQIVARLDDRDYRIALQRAEADLAAQNAAASAARTRCRLLQRQLRAD